VFYLCGTNLTDYVFFKMISADTIQIEGGWKDVLAAEFEKPYFQGIKSQLQREKHQGKIVYPPEPLIFNAFNITSFDNVKVVILGQDPYHGARQAMGLSFSVPKDVDIPASLAKIYKELVTDLPGFKRPLHGDLTKWAQQGVLLLNSVLTVAAGLPNSHKDIGWANFTDTIIRELSSRHEGLVFLLWGKFAQGKKSLIDESKHHILEAAHPSPLAGDAFLGCRHFSKTNEMLEKQGKTPINWQI
jgi:uracil-DNA glycosylase